VPVCSIQETGFSLWRLPRELPPGCDDVFAGLFDISGEHGPRQPRPPAAAEA
jgi:hypothetical protein